ncbi:hypothetical protein [Parasitella parasitica]|uniref:Uncharacterized protein n=1 Tax=Parasitella parasitica TaxID=35722 RepID=A0A0B7MUM3_9FUNG|nr:hypothetical protein [Parasitella parasitica]
MSSKSSSLAISPSRSEDLRRLREIFGTLYEDNPTQTLQDVTAILQEAHVDVFVDDLAANAYLGRMAGGEILLPPKKFSYTEIEFGQQQQQQQQRQQQRKRCKQGKQHQKQQQQQQHQLQQLHQQQQKQIQLEYWNTLLDFDVVQYSQLLQDRVHMLCNPEADTPIQVKAEQLLNTASFNALDMINACFRPVLLKQPILTFYKNLYCYYQSNIYDLLAHMRGGNDAFVTMVGAGFPEGTFMADVRRGDAAGVMLDMFGSVSFLAVELFPVNMIKSASFQDYLIYCIDSGLKAKLNRVNVNRLVSVFDYVPTHIQRVFEEQDFVPELNK